MNELSRTDSQQIDPQKKDHLKNKPTPEQINRFSNLLTKAKNSVHTKTETTKEPSKKIQIAQETKMIRQQKAHPLKTKKISNI